MCCCDYTAAKTSDRLCTVLRSATIAREPIGSQNLFHGGYITRQFPAEAGHLIKNEECEVLSSASEAF